MDKAYWSKWIKAAAMRAVKTIAQIAVATVSTAAVMGEVNLTAYLCLMMGLRPYWSVDGANGAWLKEININSSLTTFTAGLMSASDKSKLDGIATGANKTTIDSTLSSTSTNPVQIKWSIRQYLPLIHL